MFDVTNLSFFSIHRASDNAGNTVCGHFHITLIAIYLAVVTVCTVMYLTVLSDAGVQNTPVTT